MFNRLLAGLQICELCNSRKNLYPLCGRSLEIPRGRGGGGGLKSQNNILEAKYEAKLEFSGGEVGAKQKTFHEGSMDIF